MLFVIENRMELAIEYEVSRIIRIWHWETNHPIDIKHKLRLDSLLARRSCDCTSTNYRSLLFLRDSPVGKYPVTWRSVKLPCPIEDCFDYSRRDKFRRAQR
jgi:hypothetical protein